MGNRTLKDATRSWMAIGSRFRSVRREQAELKGQRFVIKTAMLALCALLTWTAVATTYVYDAQGRLVAASDNQGASARYVYDKLGNLARIDRFGAGDLAILAFSPGQGSSGAAIKITGRGFNPTPAQNIVKFNGVNATISSAAATELTAVVPAAATTGPISITVGATTASSSTSFIVDQSAKAPVILSVSPLIVSAGNSVTAIGQNFVPVLNSTDVRINKRPVIPSTLIATQVVFAVPENSGSGRVSVITPFGEATSSQDVVIAPQDIAVADITQVRRLALDAAAQGLSTATAGKYVAVLFDGASGDYLSAQFSNMSVPGIAYALYSTTNTLLGSGAVWGSSQTLHLPRLSAAGTYLLLLKPPSGPATWNLAIEKAKMLVDGAASTVISTSAAGQQKRMSFVAATGANLGLGISNLVVTGGGDAYANVTVYKPNGSSLATQNCYVANNGCDLNLSNLSAGTYSVVVQPAFEAQTMNFKATMSSDMVGLLVRDTSVALSIGRNGQNGRLRFAGNAGEALAFAVSAQTTVPLGRTVYYTVHRPDGTLFRSGQGANGVVLSLPNLPVTGNYSVLVDPQYGALVSLQAKLDTQGSLITNSSPTAYSTPANGSISLTFRASAGANLGLGLSDLVITGSSTTYNAVTVFKPDGSVLTGINCFVVDNGCDLNLSNLPAGMYSVEITPVASGQAMSFKVTLSTDVQTSLTRPGETSLNLGLFGQNARMALAGVAGETLTLRVRDAATLPANRLVRYVVYKPDGTLLTASTASTSTTTLSLSSLPVTGTYVVLVSPASSASFSGKFSLVEALTGTIAVNGASSSFMPVVDQGVSISFTTIGAENLGLGITGLTLTGGVGDTVVVKVHRQNGTTLASTSCYPSSGGCSLYLDNVAAGTYRIVVTAPPADQISFTATLSTDAVHVLTANSTIGLNLRHGQRARLTFYAAQGQTFALRAASQTTVPTVFTYYSVYKPNNAFLVSMAPSISGTINLSSLADAGNYKVMVEPQYGASLTAQVTLAAQVAGQLISGAAGASYSPIPGQNVYLSFTATAGSNLGLGLSNLTLSELNYVDVAVYKPDGSSLFTTRCHLIRAGCGLDFPNLPAGTYRVLVQPANGNQAMSFIATLSADTTGTLPRDTATPVNVTWGQNGRLTFAGTAGEALVLLAGGTSSPAYQDVEYSVLKPDGTRLTWNTSAWATQLSMASLPVTGTYTVLVNPLYGAAFTAQLTLDTTP